MEPIRLFKQGDSSVIIIPDNIIKTMGWEDGALLDVIGNEGTLHISVKKHQNNTINPQSYIPKVANFPQSPDIFRYNSGLNTLINDLSVSERRVFFLCLASGVINNSATIKPVVIRADKYSTIVGVDKSLAYKQMKDAAEFLYQKTRLIKNCHYIANDGVLKVELVPDVIDYINEVDGRKYRYTSVSFQAAFRLSGKYSWNMYQLIKSRLHKNSKSFCISVSDLITELNSVVNMDFKDFKRAVIGSAIDEIVEKTEIKLVQCINAERQGRKVSKVRFVVEWR